MMFAAGIVLGYVAGSIVTLLILVLGALLWDKRAHAQRNPARALILFTDNQPPEESHR